MVLHLRTGVSNYLSVAIGSGVAQAEFHERILSMQFVTAIRLCTTAALLTITSVSHADNITLGSFGNSPANLVSAPGVGIGQCLFSACSYGPAS